jgi:hypothetical protein
MRSKRVEWDDVFLKLCCKSISPILHKLVFSISYKQIKGLFGWAVAVKKVVVGCELWKKLL